MSQAATIIKKQLAKYRRQETTYGKKYGVRNEMKRDEARTRIADLERQLQTLREVGLA